LDSPVERRRDPKMELIDAHTHFTPPTFLKKLGMTHNAKARKLTKNLTNLAASHKNMIDLDTRLLDLDKYRVSIQIMTNQWFIDPTNFDLAGEEQLSLVKLANDGMSNAAAASRGRIYGLGGAALGALQDGGLEEMNRAINDLGLKGFMVLSNINGVPVDKYEEFWKTAESLDVPVYIHPADPVGFADRPYEMDYNLYSTLGWPFETSLVIMRLIFSGIVDRYPKLKIMTHHLGGMIPFFGGRISEYYIRSKSSTHWSKRDTKNYTAKSLLRYFRRFNYDTAVGGSEAAILCGYQTVGYKRMIYATDYPFGPQDGRLRLRTYPDVLRKAIPASNENERVFEENARLLLKL
jgi:aminocarboxymuconate-semialdehyde decarboxylase